MTIVEYIHKFYPIKERLEELNSNPIKRLLEENDWPYDKIMLIDGEWQKAVEMEDGEYISVLELLTLEADEVEKYDGDQLPIKNIYKAYMEASKIQLEEIDLSLMSAVKTYLKSQKKEEELCNKCIS